MMATEEKLIRSFSLVKRDVMQMQEQMKELQDRYDRLSKRVSEVKSKESALSKRVTNLKKKADNSSDVKKLKTKYDRLNKRLSKSKDKEKKLSKRITKLKQKVSKMPKQKVKVVKKAASAIPYEDRTLEDLQERAKELNIKGYYDMSKKELIRALRKTQ